MRLTAVTIARFLFGSCSEGIMVFSTAPSPNVYLMYLYPWQRRLRRQNSVAFRHRLKHTNNQELRKPSPSVSANQGLTRLGSTPGAAQSWATAFGRLQAVRMSRHA